MSLNEFKYSKGENAITKKYIVPVRIVDEQGATNAQWLLNDSPRQALLNSRGSCMLNKGGYIVLDLGSELQGGVDITVDKVTKESGDDAGEYCNYGKIRIVFGESVMEAMSSIGDGRNALNDHSTRDMTVETVSMSTMRYGNTGFRFVKIEAVDCALNISVVKGVLEYRDLEYKGTFSCNDERLSKIFNTAAYTVHLNMQDYIWDGIKRDRLVWVGDMHPEVSTICSVFGYDESVEKSLDLARYTYPIDDEIEANSPYGVWMVFPSYTCWWIIIHRDWYMQNGRLEYLLEQKDYMYRACKSIINRIGDDGSLDFNNSYFVDWSSNDTPYMEAGFRSCLVLALEAAAQIFDVYQDAEMSKKCLSAMANVKKIVPDFSGNKQICAMVALSGLEDAKKLDTIISKDLLKGLSTFYGYYVLHALAKADNIQAAIDIMRGYWGAMLDYGATTFWEDFDIDWIKNAGGIDSIVPDGKIDIHGTYGKFCYQKFRHSLCHGWASGPAPFISKHILGVHVLEPGCKKVKITPKLGDLQWVKGAYPTPYGVIKIEHCMVDGKIQSKVTAPEGVEIVY